MNDSYFDQNFFSPTAATNNAILDQLFFTFDYRFTEDEPPINSLAHSTHSITQSPESNPTDSTSSYGQEGSVPAFFKTSSGLDLHSKMLSPNSSSVQNRRKQHRRQNSTPAIFEACKVKPLPNSAKSHVQHRRGQSFDQAAIPDFRLFPQDNQPMVSITNSGYQNDEQQPYMQVAQQHSMAQPGLYQEQYQLQDYSYQQQQSLQQMPIGFPQHSYSQTGEVQSQQYFQDGSSLPDMSQSDDSDEREQARREIAERIEEYHKRFGNNGQSDVPKTPPATTVLPTPPSTVQKSKRTSLDVAPMPAFTEATGYTVAATTVDSNMSLTVPSSDHGYQSSYQSSISDPMSPTRSSVAHHTPMMEPIFEEPVAPTDSQLSFPDHSTLLASSSQTALDLGICFSPTRAPLSPRSALVQNPDFNASIAETGIKPEEVQAFISEQDPVDGRWTCLYENCAKTFGRRENIKSHIQTHLGDRQFRCNECQKCFVRQHDLKRHAKIHSGDKDHLCLCGAGFTRHDALTRHRQRGVCIGAFPGCFKRDVKRGRPKKLRPDMQQRVDKANRARQLDSMAEAEMSYNSSGSSSDGSQVSDVVTPPDSNAFDSTHYIDFQGMDEEYAILPTSLQDTPPMSPLGSSAAKASDSIDITSASNDFESLSMATGVSPDMLTLSPPSSQPVNSSPIQYNIDDTSSSNKDTNSPGDTSAMNQPFDDCSATSTPPQMFDENFENTIRDLDKSTEFNETLLSTAGNFSFGSDFDGEAALQANLSEWLRNVSSGKAADEGCL